MWVCAHDCSDLGSKKRARRDPRIGVRGGCEPISGIWEPNPGPLQVLQVLLTAEPSLLASHCCPWLSLVKHPLCVRDPLVTGSQKIPEEQCRINRQGKEGTMGEVGVTGRAWTIHTSAVWSKNWIREAVSECQQVQ